MISDSTGDVPRADGAAGTDGGEDAHGAPPPCGQGFSWAGEDREELQTVLEAAFDYRGDVTLFLRDGALDGGELTGYLSNRNFSAAQPFVELFPSDSSPQRKIPLGEIRGVAFSGRDTAAGKSWQTWLKKYQAKKEAATKGEQVGAIGLYPEPLD